MANEEDSGLWEASRLLKIDNLARLRQGAAVWNHWRAQNREHYVDLEGANLRGADLEGANLDGANLGGANLRGTNLRGANLGLGVGRSSGNPAVANLSLGAGPSFANLTGANLHKANLTGANLSLADLREANLAKANLLGADLSSAILVETNLTDADLTGCRIYGISAWDLKLQGAEQRDLVITRFDQPEITVDNIEVGQFIYLLLHNEKIRDVIDTITSKAVLILGRFTKDRKKVLDALREELRERHYLPVLFDFDKPASKDLTGTVSTLANMARFIIADLTDPSCIPFELATVVSNTLVPVQPILLSGKSEFAMFPDLRRRYHWVLPTHRYDTQEHLITNLSEQVIGPAEDKVREIRGLTSGSGAPAPFA